VIMSHSSQVDIDLCESQAFLFAILMRIYRGVVSENLTSFDEFSNTIREELAKSGIRRTSSYPNEVLEVLLEAVLIPHFVEKDQTLRFSLREKGQSLEPFLFAIRNHAQTRMRSGDPSRTIQSLSSLNNNFLSSYSPEAQAKPSWRQVAATPKVCSMTSMNRGNNNKESFQTNDVNSLQVQVSSRMNSLSLQSKSDSRSGGSAGSRGDRNSVTTTISSSKELLTQNSSPFPFLKENNDGPTRKGIWSDDRYEDMREEHIVLSKLMALLRKSAMDLVFPKKTLDFLLVCFMIIGREFDIFPHRAAIEFVHAASKRKIVYGLEEVSKTKVRGILTLLKNAGCLHTTSLEMQCSDPKYRPSLCFIDETSLETDLKPTTVLTLHANMQTFDKIRKRIDRYISHDFLRSVRPHIRPIISAHDKNQLFWEHSSLEYKNWLYEIESQEKKIKDFLLSSEYSFFLHQSCPDLNKAGIKSICALPEEIISLAPQILELVDNDPSDTKGVIVVNYSSAGVKIMSSHPQKYNSSKDNEKTVATTLHTSDSTYTTTSGNRGGGQKREYHSPIETSATTPQISSLSPLTSSDSMRSSVDSLFSYVPSPMFAQGHHAEDTTPILGTFESTNLSPESTKPYPMQDSNHWSRFLPYNHNYNHTTPDPLVFGMSSTDDQTGRLPMERRMPPPGLGLGHGHRHGQVREYELPPIYPRSNTEKIQQTQAKESMRPYYHGIEARIHPPSQSSPITGPYLGPAFSMSVPTVPEALPLPVDIPEPIINYFGNTVASGVSLTTTTDNEMLTPTTSYCEESVTPTHLNTNSSNIWGSNRLATLRDEVEQVVCSKKHSPLLIGVSPLDEPFTPSATPTTPLPITPMPTPDDSTQSSLSPQPLENGTHSSDFKTNRCDIYYHNSAEEAASASASGLVSLSVSGSDSDSEE
jgi:hypothetical protein